MNKGQSLKDLDLYFLPLLNSSTDTDSGGLLGFLFEQLGRWERIGPSLEANETSGYEPTQDDHIFADGKFKFTSHGKRIDVFIAA